MNKKYTRFGGEVYIYDPVDGTLTVGNHNGTHHYTQSAMKEFADEYKGMNRIHKPVALLFWIDCRNGKASNWKEVA